jgi:hypothetical protein
VGLINPKRPKFTDWCSGRCRRRRRAQSTPIGVLRHVNAASGSAPTQF